MIFGEPIPWQEAIDSRRIRDVLPTDASSAQLRAAFTSQQLPDRFRDRAMFSARTTNAWYLQRINDTVQQMVSPETALDGTRTQPGDFVNRATARLRLREALRMIDYAPAPDEAGGIKDLSSEARLNTIIDTNTRMAQGYGHWAQGQDPAVLDAWPAQELYRAEFREQKRDWVSRWRGEGGQIFNGKMIALKNAPIWTAVSAFGLPYPPFDFGSGMGVRGVSRAVAMQAGLIDLDTQVPPQSRGFNDDLETAPPVRQGELFTALLDSLGSLARFQDGVLKMAT